MSAESPDLLQLVQRLTERVDALEAELRAVQRIQAQNVPEDVMLAIAAAVAAVLGKRARIRQIHYRTDAAWAQQGRAAIQGHEVSHAMRRKQV